MKYEIQTEGIITHLRLYTLTDDQVTSIMSSQHPHGELEEIHVETEDEPIFEKFAPSLDSAFLIILTEDGQVVARSILEDLPGEGSDEKHKSLSEGIVFVDVLYEEGFYGDCTLESASAPGTSEFTTAYDFVGGLCDTDDSILRTLFFKGKPLELDLENCSTSTKRSVFGIARMKGGRLDEWILEPKDCFVDKCEDPDPLEELFS